MAQYREKCYQLEYRLNDMNELEIDCKNLNQEVERLININRNLEEELAMWKYKYTEYANLTEKVDEQNM